MKRMIMLRLMRSRGEDDDVGNDDVEEEEDDDVEEKDQSQNRDPHFVQACTIDMHLGISQGPT